MSSDYKTSSTSIFSLCLILLYIYSGSLFAFGLGLILGGLASGIELIRIKERIEIREKRDTKTKEG